MFYRHVKMQSARKISPDLEKSQAKYREGRGFRLKGLRRNKMENFILPALMNFGELL